jgi:hypothetical protein
MKGAAFQLSGVGGTVSSSVGRRVSLLCLEIIAATRYQLLPDPLQDKLLGIVWSIQDTFGFDSETEEHRRASGVLVNVEGPTADGAGVRSSWHHAVGRNVEVEECADEFSTFLALERLFERFDPVS